MAKKPVELMRKITVADLMRKLTGDNKVDMKASTPQYLFTVFGRITGLQPGETQMGTYTLFKGMFEAHTHKTGDVATAQGMILPPPACDFLEQGYISSLPSKEIEVKDDKGAVTGKQTVPDFARAMPWAFGITIGVEPSEKGSMGFRYTCKPVELGDDETDPLASLRDMVKEAGALPAPVEQKALPSPKNAPKS